VTDVLRIERREGVVVLTLNRPGKRNALSLELREELAAVLGSLAGDESVSCVVLTGAGTAFCSGMDVTQFGGSLDNRRRIVEASLAAFGALGEFPLPSIAAVNGPAVAGGFALALLCDIRIGSAEARFGFGELPRGIPPSYAAARAALPAAVARELCLTGLVRRLRRGGAARDRVGAGGGRPARAAGAGDRRERRRRATRDEPRHEAPHAARAKAPVRAAVRRRGVGAAQGAAAGLDSRHCPA
jgi:hypothetical protein